MPSLRYFSANWFVVLDESSKLQGRRVPGYFQPSIVIFPPMSSLEDEAVLMAWAY
jgi:hypothetical protein